jgi:hypothetical protein
MLEEVAAMAATFLLLTVLVQASLALTARSAADAAVAGATRRASLPGADLVTETQRLEETIAAIVPGAKSITADLSRQARSVVGVAHIRWVPPGPVLATITIAVRAEVPLAFEP